MFFVHVVLVVSSYVLNPNDKYPPSQALGHFRQWRRLAYRTASGPSAAAAELCIGHTHLRLAASLLEEGTQIGPEGNPQNDIQDGPEEGPQLDAQNDHRHPRHETRHFQLCEAHRHYRRCVRHPPHDHVSWPLTTVFLYVFMVLYGSDPPTGCRKLTPFACRAQ